MRRTWLGGALALGWCLLPASAQAFESYEANLPCLARDGAGAGCITCHSSSDGTCADPPCLNPFGLAYGAAPVWNAALASADADGDGYTNGEELGDSEGSWTMGDAAPASCGCTSRPGSPAFTPGDVDGDADGVCCRGRDTNTDGDCIDAGEHDATFDCDDGDALASSLVLAEVCTLPADNDCDGLLPPADPDCACVDPSVCDDGDDCTTDTCPIAGTCEHTPIAGCGAEDAGMDDAGADDAGLDDAGAPDAGSADSGVADGGGTPDAGMDAASTPPPEGGCSCRAGTSRPPWLALIAVGLAVLSRRRAPAATSRSS